MHHFEAVQRGKLGPFRRPCLGNFSYCLCSPLCTWQIPNLSGQFISNHFYEADSNPWGSEMLTLSPVVLYEALLPSTITVSFFPLGQDFSALVLVTFGAGSVVTVKGSCCVQGGAFLQHAWPPPSTQQKHTPSSPWWGRTAPHHVLLEGGLRD